MPISLPQELKTNKVETLPPDLKDIAQQMLADKFGVKEEAPKKADSFPGRGGWDPRFVDGIGPDEIRNGSHVDSRRFNRREPTIKVKHQPWNGDRIAEVEVDYPSEGDLIDAFRLLDRKIGRNDNRKVYVGRRFIHEMMRDVRFARSFTMKARFDDRDGVEREIGEVFGFPVISIANPHYENRCFVQQRF